MLFRPTIFHNTSECTHPRFHPFPCLCRLTHSTKNIFVSKYQQSHHQLRIRPSRHHSVTAKLFVLFNHASHLLLRNIQHIPSPHVSDPTSNQSCVTSTSIACICAPSCGLQRGDRVGCWSMGSWRRLYQLRLPRRGARAAGTVGRTVCRMWRLGKR
jgi:hypothetical protein